MARVVFAEAADADMDFVVTELAVQGGRRVALKYQQRVGRISPAKPGAIRHLSLRSRSTHPQTCIEKIYSGAQEMSIQFRNARIPPQSCSWRNLLLYGKPGEPPFRPAGARNRNAPRRWQGRFTSTPGLFCRTTCIAFGPCLKKTRIFPVAGVPSKCGLQKRCRIVMGIAFGKSASGNIQFVMTGITVPTWTTCISTR